MKLLRSSLLGALGALLACSVPLVSRAADTADNAYITQLTPAGDRVGQLVQFNSNQAGQALVVGPAGVVVVSPSAGITPQSTVLASGSATSLVTATAKDIATITLAAGTWRIYGYVDFALAGATSTLQQAGIGTAANTFGGQDTSLTAASSTTTATVTLTSATPWVQVSPAASTTYHLVASATFSAGTITGYGTVNAVQVK